MRNFLTFLDYIHVTMNNRLIFMYVPELIVPIFTMRYLNSHRFHTCLCGSTYKTFFAPAFLLGYPILVSLSDAPESIVLKKPSKSTHALKKIFYGKK